MRFYMRIVLLLLTLPNILTSQSAVISGSVEDDKNEAIPYANVILYNVRDSTMVKAGITNESGNYELKGISNGTYFLELSSLGYQKLALNTIILYANQQLKLEKQFLKPSLEKLQEVVITATKPMVEVKHDRTTFNIEGTINSVGSDGIALLSKAPGIFVDNNNNISILGRSGILVYINGKRLPLIGNELSNYLENLSSELIAKIDIITNPGVQYDAEGGAGIIDISLKKDKKLGANTSISTGYTQGRYSNYTLNANGNFRNKKLNVYASAGVLKRKRFNESGFINFLNDIVLFESNDFITRTENYNYQIGVDIFLTDEHTLGTVINGISANRNQETPSRTEISNKATPNQIDSTLVVKGMAESKRNQQTYNLYYRFLHGNGTSFNLNLDYGRYGNRSNRFQPNQYFDTNNELLFEQINSIDVPADIDIYTIKVDYETKFGNGKLELGTKLSRIETDNTYLFFDGGLNNRIQNTERSRLFGYTENVYAAYLNYLVPLSERVNISSGLRVEQTSADGVLEAFLPELEEPPVELDYLDWFPHLGISWNMNDDNRFSLNYGRRINRPDFNSLNPFNDQINLLSSEKGNPFLRPEMQNNFELGYSYKSKYNFKMIYSRAEDKITQLVGPDPIEPLATFSTWENLGFQNTLSLSSNMTLSLNNWLNTYMNFSTSYIDNQANFGDNAIIDLQVFSYKLYLQNSIKLPNGITGEISGYYNGPTVWGGVFEMDPNWKLDIGLQRKFLKDKLNARMTITDIFYTSNWSGKADFDGLRYFGSGFTDSRRISINLSYNFGNQNLKRRNREKGLESEDKRVGG